MITIIIPTYKPQEYLYECLLSIKDQNIDFSSYEVIIVLNGEKEGYYNQIVGYIKELDVSNFYLYYTEQKGVSAARNYALDMVKSDYIIFIDDDDMISTNYISSLRNKVQKRSICVSNEKIFKNSIYELEDGYVTKSFSRAMRSSNHGLLKMRSFLSSACFKIIPSEVIGNRRFNPNFRNGEDALFMASISDRIDSIYLSSEDTIYYRRAREGSASRQTKSFLSRLQNSFLLFFAYLKLYFSNPKQYNFVFFLTRFIAVFKAIL